MSKIVCSNCKGKKVFPTGWECSQCKGSGLTADLAAALKARVAELEAQLALAFQNAEAELAASKARTADLEARLPKGMQHCIIRFIECPAGHGRLTVTNWVDSGCGCCQLADLRERVERAVDACEDGSISRALEALRGR